MSGESILTESSNKVCFLSVTSIKRGIMNPIKALLFTILLLITPTVSLFASALDGDDYFLYMAINIGISIGIAIILYLIFRLIFKVRGSLLLMIIASVGGFFLAGYFYKDIIPYLNLDENFASYVVFYGSSGSCSLLGMTLSALLRKAKDT